MGLVGLGEKLGKESRRKSVNERIRARVQMGPEVALWELIGRWAIRRDQTAGRS